MAIYTQLLFAFGVYFHIVYAGNERKVTGTVGTQLRDFMLEEQTLLTRLEARIAALRSESVRINGTIVPCSCGTIYHKPDVSFTATLAKYVKGINADTTFNFTEDLTNVGQAFNSTSGRFVANVPGLYGFSLAIYMTHGYWMAMDLVKNNVSVLRARTGHLQTSKINRHNNMATNFAIVNMNTGDEVWPKYTDSSDAMLYADGVTTFTGVLLYEV